MKQLSNRIQRDLTAVVANAEGEVFELKGYAAAGMAGSTLEPLTVDETMNLPYGSELMFLPDRKPIVFNRATNQIEMLSNNPYDRREAVHPVAAFNSPGFVITHVSAYRENRNARQLPLFSYGAIGWYQGRFRTAAICVDRERRQDLRLMPHHKVVAGIRRMKQLLPGNRLRKHLENCALTYGCPAAKNFFLGRYEAPLPTSRTCNASCMGCLSLQKHDRLSNCQERIKFTPRPEEISTVALEHLRRVKKGVVSFGQGCEGDPLLAADVITPAIRRIRSLTDRGTINMNTNGSKPGILRNLLLAGLDSVRISLNSVRKNCYHAYFHPKGYRFGDVIQSIDQVRQMGKFISINYLNCPGFTDSPEETEALFHFLNKHPVDLIQWRNLNVDPVRYSKFMNTAVRHRPPIGIKTLLGRIQAHFPNIRHGYFNPPKETFCQKRR